MIQCDREKLEQMLNNFRIYTASDEHGMKVHLPDPDSTIIDIIRAHIETFSIFYRRRKVRIKVRILNFINKFR